MIDMKKIAALFSITFWAVLFTGCANEELTPFYTQQAQGKIVIRSFSALADSLQVVANGTLLEIGDKDTFAGRIETDYEFVFYDNKTENIDIVSKSTGEILHSYSFTAEKPTDTLSFFAKDGIWLDDVLSTPPGTLSGNGKTGYKFIFPTMNRFSNSGYDGAVDAIIKKTNGEILAVAENITKESFGDFVEFDFSSPPILNVELVKHGTSEPYVAGVPVIVQIVMQNNKSRLIVLNEKVDENGAFSGVEGTINLADLLNFN
jgi:hypothetical protein